MISENQLFDMKNSNVKYQEKFKIFLYQTSDISKNDILISKNLISDIGECLKNTKRHLIDISNSIPPCC